MVLCESQSRHHNGEPQGAPSRKDGEGKGKDDDNSDNDEYVHGNYLNLVQVTWHGRLSWEVLWQQPQRLTHTMHFLKGSYWMWKVFKARVEMLLWYHARIVLAISKGRWTVPLSTLSPTICGLGKSHGNYKHSPSQSSCWSHCCILEFMCSNYIQRR